MTIDTTNMCSHLQRKLFSQEGEYRTIREQIETDSTLAPGNMQEHVEGRRHYEF